MKGLRPLSVVAVLLCCAIGAMGGIAVASGDVSIAKHKKHKGKHKDAKADAKLFKKLLAKAAPTLTVGNAVHAGTADNATNATHAGTADALNGLTLISKKTTATDGASDTAARDAAPQITLFKKGPITIYGKCFRNTSTTPPRMFSEAFISTSQSGVAYTTDDRYSAGGSTGGTLLTTTTAETDRYVTDGDGPLTTNNDAYAEDPDYTPIWAVLPDGTTFQGAFSTLYKQGTLPEGDGPYGSGNVCLYLGRVFG